MGFRGNENLRAIGEEYNYTQEEIEEVLRCQYDVTYFIENYIYIVTLDKGLTLFKLYDFQKQIVEDFVNENRLIYNIGRQSGKTTVISAAFVHHVLFNSFKTCFIAANKEKIAKEILRKCVIMIENLPKFLQPEIVEKNKTDILLGNDSRIIASTTTSDAARSYSISCLTGQNLVQTSKGLITMEQLYNEA